MLHRCDKYPMNISVSIFTTCAGMRAPTFFSQIDRTKWEGRSSTAYSLKIVSRIQCKIILKSYFHAFSGNLWHHRWTVSQHTELYKSFQSQSAPCSRCSAVGLPTPNFHSTTPGSGLNIVKLESHIFHHSILIDSGVREATF